MSSLEVIEEIKRLPRAERQKVIEFVKAADHDQLSPVEIGNLVDKMLAAPTEAEAAAVRKEIIRGFYGSEPHA